MIFHFVSFRLASQKSYFMPSDPNRVDISQLDDVTRPGVFFSLFIPKDLCSKKLRSQYH